MVNTPMVLLGERILEGPKDHVTMHNVEGIQGGHRASRSTRDAAGSWPSAPTPTWRTGRPACGSIGYRQALEDAGVPFDPALVVDVVGWFRSTGAAAMRAS